MNFFNKFNKLTKRKIDYKKLFIVIGIILICGVLVVLNKNKSRALYKFTGTGTIENNLVTVEQYKTFYITYNDISYEYHFEEGMSWQNFINSDFNDGNIGIVGTELYFMSNNTEIRNNETAVIISDVILENANYITYTHSNLVLWDSATMDSLSDIPVTYSNGGYKKVDIYHDTYGNYVGKGENVLRFYTGYSNDYGTDYRSSYIIFEGINFSRYKTLEIKKVGLGAETFEGPTCGYSSNKKIPAHGKENSPSGWDAYKTFEYTGYFEKKTMTFDISSVNETKNIIILCHTFSAETDTGIYYIVLS